VDSLYTPVSSAERSFHPSNPFGINRSAATNRTATVASKAKGIGGSGPVSAGTLL
jgi:hypothetical protein